MTLLFHGAELTASVPAPVARIADRYYAVDRRLPAGSYIRKVGSPRQQRYGPGRSGISALTRPGPPVLSTPDAPVAELVDAPDSKSGGGNIVLVRVRPGAPIKSAIYPPSFQNIRDDPGRGQHRVSTKARLRVCYPLTRYPGSLRPAWLPMALRRLRRKLMPHPLDVMPLPHRCGKTWVFDRAQNSARKRCPLPKKFKASFTLGLIFRRPSKCRKFFNLKPGAPNRCALSPVVFDGAARSSTSAGSSSIATTRMNHRSTSDNYVVAPRM